MSIPSDDLPIKKDKRFKYEDDYHALAQQHGLFWVGTSLPQVVKEPTLWRCEKGHEWEATFACLRLTPTCPTCRLIGADEYHALALDLGIQWIGEVVPESTHHLTEWLCQNGHKRLIGYSHLKHSRDGCRECYRESTRHTAEDYHNLAMERGIKWVGFERPHNVNVKTLWRCDCGNEWLAQYADILQGRGCPKCSRERGKEAARATRERKRAKRQKISGPQRCRICEEVKPLTEFYRRPELFGGFRYECKECTKARSAKSQKVRIKERRLYLRWYGDKHREKLRKQRSARYRKTKGYLYSRKYRHENIERVRKNEARYRQRNRHKEVARTHKRRTMTIDDAAVEYIAILQKDVCCYCGKPGGTIDHIVAVTKDGTNDWNNLTAACLSCNSSKNNEGLIWFLFRRKQEEPNA